MSLRTRLLLMFAALAVAPLLGVGVFDYVWSSRTLEAHVAAQDSLLAARAAEALHDRVAIQASDLSFLAQNVETRRLLLALGGAGDEPLTAVRADVEPWLLEVWLRFQPSYHAIELRDAGDRTVLRFGEPPEAGAGRDEAMTASRPVPDPDAEPLGKIVAWPRIDELLPSEALEARFGVSGYSVVVDRAARRVLHHPRASRTRQPWSELAADGLVLDSARMDASSGRFAFRAGDTLRVAAFASLQSPPWTVVATSAVDEFAAPFRRMRIVNLGLVLAVLVSVSIASVWLVRRSTRPLEALTAAADRVAHGEMEPTLPPAGPDEPGRLAAAFDTMLRRIREMIAELERSRQMAAVGEFAAEVSHEMRNPLTSVKLNLQRVERLRAQGSLPQAAEDPLRIALREADRLERVVTGVLALGRPRARERTPLSLHRLLRDAVETLRPDAEHRAVAIETAFGATSDRISGDEAALRAAVLNLCANALDAMQGGGRLRLATTLDAHDGAPRVIVRVRDTGCGIPEEVRARLFRPFFTTKPDGTGLGLALASRTAEEHGGSLALEESSAAGTTFRLELPLVSP